jgi:hypothetical protein
MSGWTPNLSEHQFPRTMSENVQQIEFGKRQNMNTKRTTQKLETKRPASPCQIDNAKAAHMLDSST